MSYSVHAAGLCDSTDVGAGTQVAAFAHVLAGARIGAGCVIGDHAVVGDDVVLGDRVRLGSGVRVGDGARLADDVVAGPNVVFTDTAPDADGAEAGSDRQTVVGPGASLGANSTIVRGVSIGRRARVAAGTVVTNDVPPNAVVEGNPVRIVGYVDAGPGEVVDRRGNPRQVQSSRVPGAQLVQLTRADDLRGSLVAANFAGDLPFVPQRFFTVFGVPSSDVRGAHAHRRCHQLLVCVQGSVSALVDDGAERQEFVLDRPDLALHMQPMIWGTQYRYTSDAVLLVLASDPYDPDDYIRDHDEFLAEVARAASA
ncbi:WxcM-like domain-containing protein [Blastococcus xanthinilyticus]|uniref:Acetyltransferase-like isoleucine patch superfamily enzyme n=1 Tax=Blastococcus xanthinilyticus TaxID=1564164 RepID=A0A5S5D1B7_9ACTN|nr:WxcM-like domain-containing protein [Blastococcus xanthinilyticus]TYP89833.1 acetyltransferase-like isoleucine patch superfamily enzyme [Blastococcus xanthinilyticus]